MAKPSFNVADLQRDSGILREKGRTSAPARTPVEPHSATEKAPSERLGAYLTHDEYQAMRAAYMADIDNLATGPDSLGEWVARAVEDHARKSPERRARAAKSPDVQVPSTGPDGDKQQMKSWPTGQRAWLTVQEAMRSDRAAGLPSTTVSRWTAAAIRVAIAEARTRNGGTLPPPPEGRTPTRPRR